MKAFVNQKGSIVLIPILWLVCEGQPMEEWGNSRRLKERGRPLLTGQDLCKIGKLNVL